MLSADHQWCVHTDFTFNLTFTRAVTILKKHRLFTQWITFFTAWKPIKLYADSFSVDKLHLYVKFNNKYSQIFLSCFAVCFKCYFRFVLFSFIIVGVVVLDYTFWINYNLFIILFQLLLLTNMAVPCLGYLLFILFQEFCATSETPNPFMTPKNRHRFGVEQIMSKHHPDFNPPMPRPPFFSSWWRQN